MFMRLMRFESETQPLGYKGGLGPVVFEVANPSRSRSRRNKQSEPDFAEKLIETVENGSTSVQEQEQEAIETVLDETKRAIKKTVSEAKREIKIYRSNG